MLSFHGLDSCSSFLLKGFILLLSFRTLTLRITYLLLHDKLLHNLVALSSHLFCGLESQDQNGCVALAEGFP